MFRIRLGENWKQNPAYVGALQALAEGRSRGFSPRDIVDVLGLEMDGVDVAQGLAEAALFDAMTALLCASSALAAAPSGVERVRLAKAPVELTLAREADELTLTLSRCESDEVLATLTLDAARFFEAVRRAARRFIDDLVAIHPALAKVRLVQDLARELERKPRKRAPARARGLVLAAAVPLGASSLALRSDRPALCVLDARGHLCWTAAGPPVEALEALGGALLAEEDSPLPALLEIDRRLGTALFGRCAPVPLRLVRSAILALVAAAQEVLTEDERARLAALCRALEEVQSTPAPGAQLGTTKARRRRTSASALPAPGLRRILLREAWRADAPGPRPRLSRCGADLLVRTSGHAELRSASGERRWGAAVSDALALSTLSGERVVARDAHGALVLLDAATGTRLARAPTGLHGHLRETWALPSGVIAVHDGAQVTGLDPAAPGRCWTFEPGHDRALVATGAGEGLVLGTDRGELYGLAGDGRVAWRTLCGLDLVESVRVDSTRGVAVACGLDAEGRVGLVAVALDTGDIRWRTSLGGVRPGEPVVVPGRIIVGFEAAAGSSLAAIDLLTGKVRWKAVPPDDGGVSLAVAGALVLVARAGGGLAGYDRSGRLVFAQGARDPDPALSPVRARAPIVGAGLALVAGALVHLFDAASGRPVASFEPAELAPDSLALLDGPVIVSASREGLLEAWRSRGHLAVVPPLPD